MAFGRLDRARGQPDVLRYLCDRIRGVPQDVSREEDRNLREPALARSPGQYAKRCRCYQVPTRLYSRVAAYNLRATKRTLTTSQRIVFTKFIVASRLAE